MISRVSVALLVIALLALAGLQYHWIGQISVAERQRLEQSVRDSSNRFAADFAGEIRSLTNALDIRGVGEPEVSTIVARAHGWAEAAAYPDLLKTMYLVRPASSGEFHLSQVNVQNSSLVPVQWPAKWTALQALLQRDPFVVERRPNGNSNIELPKAEGTPTVLIQYGGGRPPDPQRGRGGQGFGRGQGRGGPQEFRRGPPPQRAPEPPPRGNPPSRQGQGPGEPPPPPPPRGGRAAEPPPQRAPEPPPQDRPQPAQALQPAPPAAWLLVELDDTAFTKQIFPALFARDFPMTEDQDYRIAVVSATPQQIIFSTGNAWTTEDLASPDYSMDLIGFGPGGPRGNPGNPGNFFGAGQRGGAPQPAFYIGQPLRLLAKHEAGSLEIAVSNLRRRNLAVSFGILLVLGLGAGVVIISGQRARTLGKLQMEFAAAVSHELRTPLAVIQSAAHNLRSGVVKDREGIEEYATIVQKEARRLSTMVEQVMTYAETQSGRKRYDIAPVDLNEVVDRALQHLAIPLGDAKATVENRMDPALPPAMADEVAMTQCVQNLLSNAVKYGSGKDSVQIEIESEVDRAAGTIRIHVIDHGAGVPSVDEKHLFDPFHRGENAATNTPGNGLGLHLVQRIMESQKGTVSYKRAPHGGACFTLTLPLGNDGMKL